MNLLIRTSLVATLCSFCVVPIALAGTGNGAPSGPHYNLNIIGVEKAKKADMTGSNRHTIFVPLYSKTTGNYSKSGWDPNGDVIAATALVDSKIWLTPGPDFQVCDGNGFDEAYGCPDSYFDTEWNTIVYDADGNPVPLVDTKEGAVFQLPCNNNLYGLQAYIDTDGVNGGDTYVDLDHMIGCNEVLTVDGDVVPVEQTDVVPEADYQVWARALGKPGGSATLTTCATVDGELQCSLENTVQTRTKGKSTFADVTNEVTSLVVSYCDGDIDTDGTCLGTVTYDRIALFAGDTEDWFWNYDNNGLRLAQLRFYSN